MSGTTHEQHLLGARGINTVEPRNIEEVLSNQFEDFSLGLRPKHFAPLMGSGILTQDGAAWKHSRVLLHPQFSSNHFQNFEAFKKCVESFISFIPADGVVDLQPLFFRLTFDTTTFLLFGENMSSLHSTGIAGQGSEIADAFNLSQDYLSHHGRLGEYYWLASTPEFRRACRTSHRFIDQAVQRALEAPKSSKHTADEEGKRQYVFIDALIQETRDKKELHDQCLNVFLAGRDTIACCLTWILRFLARHPLVLSKLREKIASTSGLSADASPILIQKGEAVGYCVYAMHRRKDIYGKDALEFRPERWKDGKLLRDVGYGYLPFNSGPSMLRSGICGSRGGIHDREIGAAVPV
ncbi:cytochrome P450 [Plenodomus tracheiphilus IPT5]|uniref:Cytochrome P450 n=1 Tax=Plenodomus tracheiphilus IPT5 TaxID=1408161 RepID=A0A6A7AYM2_9PLEO|nr:cytochrome P450 [Plenodomus tracheiphilus IPT5]